MKYMNIWILVWLRKILIWWKRNTFLNGYRHLYCSCNKDIAKDVETRFGISYLELNGSLTTEKKGNAISERSIRCTNHEGICRIKSTNIAI